ncbi:MAG: S1C family serine protease [Alphaproteobacteria bacterium]
MKSSDVCNRGTMVCMTATPSPHRPRLRFAGGVAAVVALMLAGAAPARAFDPAILQSVVSVLPEWPDSARLPEAPEGTAVAVLEGGYLATNVHVLGRAKRLRIRLDDGRVLPAEIVGIDPPTDIALIKAPLDLPVPETAPAPALGAPVCAIGNQFGLGLSVTCGVVSALNRTGAGFNPIEDFIQTDATVNPGGSGGALIDGTGRLVGLVSAIFTKKSDADIGVNFAASMALVMRVVEDLRAHGRVIRGRLGLAVADLDLDERRSGAGARVMRVAPDSGAAAAGLAPGDIVVAVAGRPIRKASDVTAAVQLHRIGDSFAVTYLRGGARREVTVTLGR